MHSVPPCAGAQADPAPLGSGTRRRRAVCALSQASTRRVRAALAAALARVSSAPPPPIKDKPSALRASGYARRGTRPRAKNRRATPGHAPMVDRFWLSVLGCPLADNYRLHLLGDRFFPHDLPVSIVTLYLLDLLADSFALSGRMVPIVVTNLHRVTGCDILDAINLALDDDMTLRPQMMILAVLVHLAKHYGKAYAYPSQETILKRLNEKYFVKMSRATLNRHLKALEMLGWFSRVQRHRKRADGSLEMHSTLYKLARESFKLFAFKVTQAVDNFQNRVQTRLKNAVSLLRQKNPINRKNKAQSVADAFGIGWGKGETGIRRA